MFAPAMPSCVPMITACGLAFFRARTCAVQSIASVGKLCTATRLLWCLASASFAIWTSAAPVWSPSAIMAMRLKRWEA